MNRLLQMLCAVVIVLTACELALVRWLSFRQRVVFHAVFVSASSGDNQYTYHVSIKRPPLLPKFANTEIV